jgi:hypothetical protein
MKNIVSLIITFIIVAACVAIAVVACSAMGIAIPGWVMQIGWIIVIVVVAVVAIKFVVSVTGGGEG